MSIIKINLQAENPKLNGQIIRDQFTDDQNIKLKARSINLIKHNPNLFTNRGGFVNMIGGEATICTVLGCGLIGMIYRRRVNTLRQIPSREGIWYNTVYFLFGASVGVFYSACYFMKFQVFINDYFANFLLKRYKGSGDLARHNIYRLRDQENTDECYNFTNSYANNFHL